MRERYAGSDIGAVLSGAELLFISEKLELAYRMYSYDPSGKDSFLLQNSILITGFSLLIAFVLPQSRIQRIFKILSNYWIGIFFCALFLAAAGDLIGLFIPRKDQSILAAAGVMILAAVMIFTVYGSIHARQIDTMDYAVTVDKACAGRKELKVALAADLHLGYNSGLSQVKKMVKQINRGSLIWSVLQETFLTMNSGR